jgi:hypothetical protein
MRSSVGNTENDDRHDCSTTPPSYVGGTRIVECDTSADAGSDGTDGRDTACETYTDDDADDDAATAAAAAAAVADAEDEDEVTADLADGNVEMIVCCFDCRFVFFA